MPSIIDSLREDTKVRRNISQVLLFTKRCSNLPLENIAATPIVRPKHKIPTLGFDNMDVYTLIAELSLRNNVAELSEDETRSQKLQQFLQYCKVRVAESSMFVDDESRQKMLDSIYANPLRYRMELVILLGVGLAAGAMLAFFNNLLKVQSFQFAVATTDQEHQERIMFHVQNSFLFLILDLLVVAAAHSFKQHGVLESGYNFSLWLEGFVAEINKQFPEIVVASSVPVAKVSETPARVAPGSPVILSP